MAALALVCTFIFTPWQTLWIWITPLPESIQEQVNDATGLGFDGIIVYVNQRGKPPASYASGLMNKENNVKTEPDALFKIASISKLYLAVATVKLVNNKSLALDDTLSKLLPEIAGRIENADQITLRMLLTHRSGIPDWINDKAFPWGSPPTDVNKVLSLVLDDDANFKPNTRYQYSNTNYLLIGNILDKTLGYSHQQYIKKEILAPLGLVHTFGSLSEVDPKQVMCGYDSHYQGDVKMLDFVSPSGAMVATAEDVGIFLRALNDGSLLNDEEQKIYSAVYEYGHTGLLPGYMSIARYHKDIDAVVVQFVNTSGGNNWGKSDIIYKRVVKILKTKS
ncbi:serine hydrolase domain-containing protein [Pseudochryseolinea flava]|nr:serine hydrolase domain-containing protein [Pseudochryseolinea flava]